MKSTKAMQISTGVLVQVTTETKYGNAEALTFVPHASIWEKYVSETGATVGIFKLGDQTPKGRDWLVISREIR